MLQADASAWHRVLAYRCGWVGVLSVLQAEASARNTDTTPTQPHRNSNTTSIQEQYDQCGNSTEWSQAPDDGYINVRNMLST